MTELDEREHIAVLTPMIEATVGPDPDTAKDRVYEYGKVPGADGNDGVLPRIYVLISIGRRFAPPNKGDTTARSGWRVSLRYVGHTVDEARWAGSRIAAALDRQRINVAGLDSTAITHESTTPVKPDAGLFSGLVSYTYAL
jgi:hypothetical protein